MPWPIAALLSVVTCLGASGVVAHEGEDAEHEVMGGRVLGKITFPTSTRERPAHVAFIQGMLFLHLFEYEFAAERFQRAQELDPGFAMAYWGEAMTHNHPIWDEQDRDQARAVLARLGATPAERQARAGNAKERAWLAALDILYGEGPKAKRDAAYARHLGEMAATWPEDDEVRLFHALALMGLGAGVRDVPTYMQAAALAQGAFYRNREHPGAAHYLIHAVDDPVHAPLGLEAAEALARMAPDAGHSLHMTTHIFVAVGQWDAVVDRNREAIRVQNGMRVIQGLPPRHWGHYNFWMLYGLLQQGRRDEARELLQAAYDEVTRAGVVPVDPLNLDADRSQVGSVVQMWARYLVETRFADASLLDWTFNTGDAFDPRLNLAWVRGMQRAWAGDADGAQLRLREFSALSAELRQAIHAMDRQAPTDLLYLERLAVLEQELRAVIARAEGDLERAIELAAEASRLEGEMPYSFGPPFVDLPSAELLGELLLAAGRRDEARQTFELQLQRTRNKTLAREGLARAGLQVTGR